MQSTEASWLRESFEYCCFGDKRLVDRLFKIAGRLLGRLTTVLSASQATPAERKAAYRFFSHKRVTMEALQTPHQEVVGLKSQEVKEVLVIEDTTYMTFGKGKAPARADYQGTNQFHGVKSLVVHSALCLGPDEVPLGVVYQRIYTHQSKSDASADRPITDKESYRWLEAATAAVDRIDPKKVIVICDREGDIFELFHHCATLGCRLIVRKHYDRQGITKDGEVCRISHLLQQPSSQRGLILLSVYDAKQDRLVERQFALYDATFQMAVPQHLAGKGYQPIPCGAIRIVTVDEGEPIEWLLLTNIALTTPSVSFRVVQYYRTRWHVENYHKVMKSGLDVEKSQLENIDALENLVALIGILAVRLYYIQQLARSSPTLSCEVILTPLEWKALYIQAKRCPPAQVPDLPPTLHEAVYMIASIGGYVRRKTSPPGIITLWRGWQRFSEVVDFLTILNQLQTYG